MFMPASALPIDLPDDEAVLREVAAMDLALARKHFAEAMAESDPQISAELGRAYQRMARSLRQSIALRARLAQDAENHRIAHTPIWTGESVLAAFRRAPATAAARPKSAAPETPAPARDEDAHVRARKVQLRLALQTVIWSEREAGELDRAAAARLRDRVDDLLWRTQHPPDFAAGPLGDHVAALCDEFGLTFDPDWAERRPPPDIWANPAPFEPCDGADEPVPLPSPACAHPRRATPSG
jgi:hypothetical protein